MAHPAAGSQADRLVEDGREDLVGVERALHQGGDAACARFRHRELGRSVTVGRVEARDPVEGQARGGGSGLHLG